MLSSKLLNENKKIKHFILQFNNILLVNTVYKLEPNVFEKDISTVGFQRNENKPVTSEHFHTQKIVIKHVLLLSDWFLVIPF